MHERGSEGVFGDGASLSHSPGGKRLADVESEVRALKP